MQYVCWQIKYMGLFGGKPCVFAWIMKNVQFVHTVLSVLYAVIAANLFKNPEFNRILCKPNFPISALGLRNCIPFLCLSLCFLCLSQSFLCLSLCFLCLSLFLSCFSMLPLSVSIPFLCLSLCFLCLSLSFLCLSLCFICLFLCFFARSPCFFSLYT